MVLLYKFWIKDEIVHPSHTQRLLPRREICHDITRKRVGRVRTVERGTDCRMSNRNYLKNSYALSMVAMTLRLTV